MMPALPVWPPTFIAAAGVTAPRDAMARDRWMIVDGTIRREVSEREYRAELDSCLKIEVVRYPHEAAITHVCYR